MMKVEMRMAGQEHIQYLLKPASIAVVGASDNPSRIGGRLLRILSERGYKGEVYPVNPKYSSAQGLTCYPTIASLPTDVELFVICLPAEAAVVALEEAAQVGARAAVMFSGGFAEVGEAGRILQTRLARIVADSNIALVGPNSLGVASFANSSFATFATALATLPKIEGGDIALVSQSGGTAFNLFTESFWAGARFSHVIATGNEAGLTFSDYLRYLASDASTRAVIGYVEGVTDGEQFAEALEGLRRAGKPVFLIKAGASERGSLSVASHTAQMSGDDCAFDALFTRYGVTRLASMDEAVDVARALSLYSEANGVAVATNSGGAAAYLADACDQFGVPLANLQTETREALAATLPHFAGLNNPVDFTAQIINDRSLLWKTLELLDKDDAVDVLLVFLGSMEYLADDLLAILKDAQERLTNPLVVSWLGVSERVRMAGMDAGLTVCADPSRVLRGLGLLRAGRHALQTSPGGPIDSALRPSVEISQGSSDEVGALVARPVEGERAGLDEWQVMELLERAGVQTPRRILVHSAAQAIAAAEKVGYPCVLKLIDPFLAHRAKVGAVRTGLCNSEDLSAAFQEMQNRHKLKLGLIVEQAPAGLELIVGVLADPIFGSRAILGLGGIWANEVNDVRTLVPPYDNEYVKYELSHLKRNQLVIEAAGGDIESLAAEIACILQSLNSLVNLPSGGITEIECNPVLVTPDGIIVLDALAFVEAEA